MGNYYFPYHQLLNSGRFFIPIKAGSYIIFLKTSHLNLYFVKIYYSIVCDEKIKELIKTFKNVDKSFMLFKKVHFYTFSICWKVELCFAENRQLFHVGRIYFLFKSIRNMKIWESRCVEPSQNLKKKKNFFQTLPLIFIFEVCTNP